MIDKILKEREDSYGDFKDNARKTTKMFNILTDNRPCGCKAYPAFMIITKLVREFNKHNKDNLDDIQGYAKLWAEDHYDL
ncbi:MAG: hypothetical protein GF334_05075 [Candidatus Altiarchaeales archaeon]|nr:hypothetical protein [Candidatus Altiarchaeales archaeon]